MNDVAIDRALRALPHFRTLPSDLVAQVTSMARRRRFDAGELVFTQGEACRAFYAIESGGVRLYRCTEDGREQVVHNLHAGATFAEAALLSFGRFPVNAAATEKATVLLEIGGEGFLELFRSDPRLAACMVASLSMRLVSLVERVEELSLVQAGSRLARWLLRQPTSSKDPPAIALLLPKKELAAHLAMTPETLSRLLRHWQEAGWIDSERARIVLRTPERLLELADGIAPAP